MVKVGDLGKGLKQIHSISMNSSAHLKKIK